MQVMVKGAQWLTRLEKKVLINKGHTMMGVMAGNPLSGIKQQI